MDTGIVSKLSASYEKRVYLIFKLYRSKIQIKSRYTAVQRVKQVLQSLLGCFYWLRITDSATHIMSACCFTLLINQQLIAAIGYLPIKFITTKNSNIGIIPFLQSLKGTKQMQVGPTM